MQKRRRPAALEYAVFGLAAFLALFLAYEVVKRRVKPPSPPVDAPPAATAPAEAPMLEPREPQAVAGRGPLPRVKVDRVVKPKRREGPAIPAPVR